MPTERRILVEAEPRLLPELCGLGNSGVAEGVWPEMQPDTLTELSDNPQD